MINTDTIWINNDNLIEVHGARAASTGAYLNSAVVTITIKDSSGVNVTGESWPFTLAYVAGSNGIYRGTLADTLSLTEHANYVATVIVDGGSGKKGEWEIDVMALRRRG